MGENVPCYKPPAMSYFNIGIQLFFREKKRAKSTPSPFLFGKNKSNVSRKAAKLAKKSKKNINIRVNPPALLNSEGQAKRI